MISTLWHSCGSFSVELKSTYCSYVVTFYMAFSLLLFFFLKTCLILQFFFVQSDLCRPLFQRPPRMKWNEMSQCWCGSGSIMAWCLTKWQDSHRAVPIMKWASKGQCGLSLKIDLELSTPTHKEWVVNMCMKILLPLKDA